MSLAANNTLEAVRTVYSGAEGELWELLMGQQIHIGGFKASTDLAERAQIGAGQQGVDLCCCNGAGMRFLVRYRGVAAMTGIDATEAVIERAKSAVPLRKRANRSASSVETRVPPDYRRAPQTSSGARTLGAMSSTRLGSFRKQCAS